MFNILKLDHLVLALGSGEGREFKNVKHKETYKRLELKPHKAPHPWTSGTRNISLISGRTKAEKSRKIIHSPIRRYQNCVMRNV